MHFVIECPKFAVAKKKEVAYFGFFQSSWRLWLPCPLAMPLLSASTFFQVIDHQSYLLCKTQPANQNDELHNLKPDNLTPRRGNSPDSNKILVVPVLSAVTSEQIHPPCQLLPIPKSRAVTYWYFNFSSMK